MDKMTVSGARAIRHNSLKMVGEQYAVHFTPCICSMLTQYCMIDTLRETVFFLIHMSQYRVPNVKYFSVCMSQIFLWLNCDILSIFSITPPYIELPTLEEYLIITPYIHIFIFLLSRVGVKNYTIYFSPEYLNKPASLS